MSRYFYLSDQQWALIKPHLPQYKGGYFRPSACFTPVDTSASSSTPDSWIEVTTTVSSPLMSPSRHRGAPAAPNPQGRPARPPPGHHVRC